MPPKPTPHQLSKNLTYVKKVPTFLQGLVDSTDSVRHRQSDYDEPTVLYDHKHDKYDSDDDEDDEVREIASTRDEERPQIVVLKEGKHMNEEEVRQHLNENKKTKESARGPSTDDRPAVDQETGKILFRKPKKANKDTSHKESSNTGPRNKETKDNSIGDLKETIEGMKRKRDKNDSRPNAQTTTKKSKKAGKTLLSFDDV